MTGLMSSETHITNNTSQITSRYYLYIIRIHWEDFIWTTFRTNSLIYLENNLQFYIQHKEQGRKKIMKTVTHEDSALTGASSENCYDPLSPSLLVPW